MDEAVRRWKPKGRVFFWNELDRRQGEGWHIAADSRGCDDLEEIVRLALAADHPASFTFPAVLGAPGMTALMVAFDAAYPADHWRLEKGDPAKLALGVDGLKSLRDAVVNLRKGAGDYCVGPDAADQGIWIWWPPKA